MLAQSAGTHKNILAYQQKFSVTYSAIITYDSTSDLSPKLWMYFTYKLAV